MGRVAPNTLSRPLIGKKKKKKKKKKSCHSQRNKQPYSPYSPVYLRLFSADMGLHNPLPSSMASECKKCGKILASFVDPRQAFGPDKIIPPQVLANAKGLVILTVIKAGYLPGFLQQTTPHTMIFPCTTTDMTMWSGKAGEEAHMEKVFGETAQEV